MKKQRLQLTTSILCICILLTVSALSGPVTAQNAKSSEFTQRVYQEEQGDIAMITVEVQPDTETTLRLTGYQYKTELDIADHNGDGEITIQINTFMTLSEERGSGFSVAESDHLTNIKHAKSTQLNRGYYNLTLASGADVAQLHISSPNFGHITSRALASGTQPSGETIQSNASQTATTARGDMAVVSFDAEGIGGVGRLNEPPGANQIVAQNATANATTTHTLQLSGAAIDSRVSQLRIDYRNQDAVAPSGLALANVEYIGVDTDSDGIIEQSWEPYISSVTTNSEGIVTIALISDRTLAESDRLLVQYGPVTNPKSTGVNNVTVDTGAELVNGNIEYGYTARGNLGNGINVAVTSNSSQEFHAPLPFEYIAESRQDQLHIVLNTTGYDELTNESLSVTLSRVANKNFSSDEASAEIGITEPAATVELPESRQWNPENGNLSIHGNATLAAGNKIWIQVRSSERQYSQFLYHYPAIISENQTYVIELEANTFDEGNQVYIRPITRSDGSIGPTKQLIIVD